LDAQPQRTGLPQGDLPLQRDGAPREDLGDRLAHRRLPAKRHGDDEETREEGYLKYTPHRGAYLTEEGWSAAEEALCRVLKHPDTCPDDGKVIPPCSKEVSSCLECMEMRRRVRKGRELVPLTALNVGEEGVIAFIRGGRAAVQRLMDMGLTQGTRVKVLASAPFNGPLELMVRGANLAIGRGLARRIFVKAATP